MAITGGFVTRTFIGADAIKQAKLADAAPDLAKVSPRAASFLRNYAEYIRTVPPDELERHPYLPELEEVVADLRAAIKKATGA